MDLEARFHEFLEKYIEEKTQTRMRLEQGEGIMEALRVTDEKVTEAIARLTETVMNMRFVCAQNHPDENTERRRNRLVSPQTMGEWIRSISVLVAIVIGILGGAISGIKALVSPSPSGSLVTTTEAEKTAAALERLGVAFAKLEKEVDGTRCIVLPAGEAPLKGDAGSNP